MEVVVGISDVSRCAPSVSLPDLDVHPVGLAGQAQPDGVPAPSHTGGGDVELVELVAHVGLVGALGLAAVDVSAVWVYAIRVVDMSMKCELSELPTLRGSSCT